MMKTYLKLLVISLVLSVFLSGCFLKSVHPLVKDKDAVELSGISGIWEKDDQRWTFIKEGEFENVSFNGIQGHDLKISMADRDTDSAENENPVYLVVYEDLNDEQPDSAYFFGKFVQLDQNYYLDLYPFDVFDIGFWSGHLFPVHTFSKVELNNDSLTINLFKDSWIEEQIRDNRVRIKHERIDDSVLITASTEELQKFIIKYGNMSEAFRDPITMNRIEP